MSTAADVPRFKSPNPMIQSISATKRSTTGTGVKSAMSTNWLGAYGDFITKNNHQVSQIESTLRSLTYIIPGRFRDAEIASESIHSGVQLLSLYHDTLLFRASSKLSQPSLANAPSPHKRYIRFWFLKSPLYRRVAYLLQIVNYVELLIEMAAKRRGERIRWRAVIIIEAIKAFCKLLLLRITKSRPLITPVLPEREPLPEAPTDEESAFQGDDSGYASASGSPQQSSPDGEWTMPRTGMSLPTLPSPGDISSYLLSRVLTADDIKPAAKLVNQLQGSAQVAEILHILSPLAFAVAMARSKNKRKAWTPWVLGLAIELVARQLRDRSLRTTPLEKEEWSRRGWALGWWMMRGAFYENITKSMVEGVRKRMPSLIGGILEDYEYLWENYHFSTSP
ncbi:peroxisome membrane protein [Neurospora tetraspora]|uniref:Peroxisomal membrane protein PEX16 n=1 Tax=Neurospora tetraspora TaxID=94610 RepID=A0AAE0MVE5_9PEZI|nr:peroxisome membrane protein [Neurospora tetraspora]